MGPLKIVPPEKTTKKLEYCLPSWNSTLSEGKKTQWLSALSWKNLISRFRQSFQISVCFELYYNNCSIIVFNFNSGCAVYYSSNCFIFIKWTQLHPFAAFKFFAQTYDFLQYSDGFFIWIEEESTPFCIKFAPKDLIVIKRENYILIYNIWSKDPNIIKNKLIIASNQFGPSHVLQCDHLVIFNKHCLIPLTRKNHMMCSIWIFANKVDFPFWVYFCFKIIHKHFILWIIQIFFEW